MGQRTITTELPVELWQFASDIARLVKPARVEFLTRVLNGDNENDIVKELQPKYGLNKRQVNAIRSEIQGCIASAKKCRERHLKLLAQQIRSTQHWLKTAEKSLRQSQDACSIRFRKHLRTHKRFLIHNKKRRLYLLENKLNHLKNAPLNVTLGGKGTQYSTVGSKGESFGNQITQYDGNTIMFRVPYALESKYGKTITAPLRFEYEQGQQWINEAIQKNRALSYRIYCKDFRWFIACSTDVPQCDRVSLPRQYGCLGLDINPGVIGWAYVDTDGNLKHHGQFKLNLHSRRSGQIKATLHDVTRQIVRLAQSLQCPIVIENLDFSAKKSQMREEGKRYARMLSGFAYGELTKQLEQKCEVAGIELIKVNPAYSSLIGLVKFMKQYGLSSDTAAAMVLARRAMRLSERVPNHNAYAGVKSAKHVWSAWCSLQKKLKPIRRHQYFTLSDRELEVRLCAESSGGVQSKRKRTSRCGASPQRSNRAATVTKP